MLQEFSFKFIFLFLTFCVLFLTPSFGKNSDDFAKLPFGAQKVLEKVLNGKDIKNITPLKGGFSSSRLYKITTDNQLYVLRRLDPNRSFLNREREIKCMQIASDQGIAPHLYYANAKDGILIMEFVQSIPLSERDRAPEILLPCLAQILRKIHDGPPFPLTLSVYESIEQVTSTLASQNIKLPTLITHILTQLQPIGTLLKETVHLSPCHNDLNPNNILFTKNAIKIIDWEAAGLGDPYFDLATISIFFTFNQNEHDILLKSYFRDAPTPYQKARLYLMEQLALCHYGIHLFELSLSKNKSVLTPKEITDLPDLSNFLRDIGSGKIKLDNSASIQKFSLVAFKQACKNMRTNEFSQAKKTILNAF